MRRKFNRAAICSSENYEASKNSHIDYLKEKHEHFKDFLVDGEICINTPISENDKWTPRFKTIRIFGKNMRVTIEEYNTHCKHLGL